MRTLHHDSPRVRTTSSSYLLALTVLIASQAFIWAGNGLKVINNPGGGQVVYGVIDQQNTPQGAMGAVLQAVQRAYGSVPMVGSAFQIRNTGSYAAFFTLVAKDQGHTPVVGEVIVAFPKGAQPVGAILADSAQHITTSLPALMRELADAWHASNPIGPVGASPDRPLPLHRVTGGDRSAIVSLPDGWALTGVSGGKLTADGPYGEKVNLGMLIQQIYDPRVLRKQRLPPGAGPFVVCSVGGDLFSAYVSVINQTRQLNHLPAASFRLISSQNLPGIATEGSTILAFYDLDLHDGLGLRTGSARISRVLGAGPTWAMGVQSSSLPKAVAVVEAPTMKAIVASYAQDPRVINAELQQKLAEIRAIGERSKIMAQAADQRRIASAQAFDAHMDNINRQSKVMQNRTLDRSQIQDNELNGRATVANDLADDLVRSDPNRYQIVPPSQMQRGVDYSSWGGR